MFRYGWRRSPLRLFAMFVAGVLLINLIAGLLGGALALGLGLVLFLPFLLFKMFLLFMILGAAMHFVGGRRPFWRREPRRETEEEAEFREAVRKARERLDDLFPQA